MGPPNPKPWAREVLERASPELLGEILAGVGELDKVLCAVLKQALFLVYAPQGLVITSEKIVMAVGYDGAQQQALRRRLEPLLLEGGQHYYCGPHFDLGGPPAAGGKEAEGPVRGMAGVITAENGTLAVVAVEREPSFGVTDQRRFAEWLGLAAIPAGAAQENTRAARLRESTRLRLRDLPLERLEELPNLREIEHLLIAEAMRRTHNNKTEAAALLGITREALRKKILRWAT